MEVKISISNSDRPIKELTESHTSDLPSLISAISRIKESTNSFLTEVINNTAPSGKGDGNGAVENDERAGDDEEEEDDDDDGDDDEGESITEIETKHNYESSKRKSTNQDDRKRLKT